MDPKHVTSVNGRWGTCHYFTNDMFIGKSLQAYGEYNPDETEFVLALAEKAGRDKVTLDIGANIGVISQALEHSGFKVEAFEPQPEVFALLRKNIRGPAHNMALADKEGTVKMPAPDFDEEYNFGSAACGTVSKNRGGVQVPVRTLDSYNFNNVGVIKIDVEGFEERVLRGAAETIRRCKPILYLEDDRKDKSESLHAFIRELGYKWEKHTPRLYRAKNFFGNPADIWNGGDFISRNIVCTAA